MDEVTADARVNELRDVLLDLIEMVRGVDMRDNEADYLELIGKVERA